MHTDLLGAELAVETIAMLKEYEQTFGEMDVEEEFKIANLLRMTERIRDRAGEWPTTKIHRHLGFVWGVMAALNVCGIKRIRKIMQDAKARSGFPEGTDEDLRDHNNPDHSYEIELGGEG